VKTDKERPKRVLAARAFTFVEDVVYLGLGLLLASSALALLITSAINFVQSVLTRSLATNVVPLLDRLLLILLIIELLYTVQVSFREHVVLPEPFLLVGLIAAVRRILVLTAEFPQASYQDQPAFQHLIIELAVLTVLVVALVISLVLLSKRGVEKAVERAP
jgi:uncharacterized membrane protein (DUF373 family)